MPTVIGRFMCKNDGPKRPRPARGVREGLSCMKGNFHVQFLGEGVAATPPPYPARMEKVSPLVSRKGLRTPGQAENLASRLPYSNGGASFPHLGQLSDKVFLFLMNSAHRFFVPIVGKKTPESPSMS